MATETIARKWRCGARLAGQINREREDERATRRGCEIERLLAICRRCGEFRGDDCALFELTEEFNAQGDADRVSPTFAQMLTRAELPGCAGWRARQAVTPRRPVTEEGLDRLHRQGINRSQEERRHQRREGRRRAKKKTGSRN